MGILICICGSEDDNAQVAETKVTAKPPKGERDYVWADTYDSDLEPGVSSAQPFGMRKARKSAAQRRVEKRVSEQAKQLPMAKQPQAEHSEQSEQLEPEREQPELAKQPQPELEQLEKRNLMYRLVESLHESQHLTSEELAMYKSMIEVLEIGSEVSDFCRMLASRG